MTEVSEEIVLAKSCYHFQKMLSAPSLERWVETVHCTQKLIWLHDIFTD